MITKLRIQNFLSLRDVRVQIDRKNFLLGRNMSGKSNFLKSLMFLSKTVTAGLSKASVELGGFQELPWKGGEGKPVSFDLSANVQLSSKVFQEFDYHISVIGTEMGVPSIQYEKLTATLNGNTVTLIDLENGYGTIKNFNGESAFATGQNPLKSGLEYDAVWDGTPFRNFLSRIHFYALSPSQMRTLNVVEKQNWLAPNGANLASWLFTLSQHYRHEFDLIKQAAMDVLPELEEVLTPPNQFPGIFLTTHEKYLKRPVSVWHMSDGELAFLALLSIIYAPEELGASIYCVEEPENYLHPRLIETLINLLTQRQETLSDSSLPSQVFISTHSPLLIDKVGLDELLVFNKEKGATQVFRPNTKPHLIKMLESEEVGLGDLWYAGSLDKN